MHLRRSWRRDSTIALLLACALISTLGCHPGRELEITNGTDSPVTITWGNERRPREFEVTPGDSLFFWVHERNTTPLFTVRNPSGRLLTEFWFRWDEMVDRDFKVVVTDY